MGTPAKYNVDIECKSPEAGTALLELLGDQGTEHSTLYGNMETNRILADYFGASSYFDIRILERDAGFINLEIYSDRFHNAEWQLEQLVKFLSEHARDLVETFSSSGWIYTDGISFDSAEELDELVRVLP